MPEKTEIRQIHPAYFVHRDVNLMTLPLLLMAFFFYGPRPLLLAVIAIITARLADRLACVLRSRKYDATDNSSLTIALIIVLMLPATVRFRVVVMAVLVGVLVVKEAFGGYMCYPFNPSAVGFCMVAVSWPEEVLRYPQPRSWLLNLPQNASELFSLWRFEDATLVEGASYTLRAGGLPNISIWNLLLGNYPGAIGATAALVILSCAVYLIVRRRISVAAMVSFLVTVALIAFIFPRFNEISFATFPYDYMKRLAVVQHEVLGGSMMFAAVFLVSEPGTLPATATSRALYGGLLGLATMLFRYFGIYELGACFAFLLVNAVSGWFDRAISGRKKGKSGEVPA